MRLLRRKQTALAPRQAIQINETPKRTNRIVWSKVLFVVFFAGLIFILGRKVFTDTPTANIVQDIPQGNVIVPDKVDNNPIAITTPEISDYVLEQPDRVRNEATLDALNTELQAIENERREIENRQAALNAELEYLEGNALVIQTQQSAALQNQLAELDIRRGNVQLKIEEAKGLAEALAVELEAIAQATQSAEAARIENIKTEAEANRLAAEKQAESDAILAQSKKELARANLYESILPLASQLALALITLVLAAAASPFIATKIRQAIEDYKYPVTRQTPDVVDEFLGSAARRARTRPTPRNAPPKRENSRNPQNSTEFSQNSENSSPEQGGKRTVGEVEADYPWLKDWFNESQLEIIAGGLGSARPAGIVWNIAKMEISEKGRVSRQDIRAALRISGAAYKDFFADVEQCKEKILNKVE